MWSEKRVHTTQTTREANVYLRRKKDLAPKERLPLRAKSLIVLLLLVVLILAIGQTRLVYASGTLDQHQDVIYCILSSCGVFFCTSFCTASYWAQLFTAGLTGGLTEVDLAISTWIYACTGCSPVTVEIHAGSPTGALLASTSEPASAIPAETLPPTLSFFAFNFATPASVSSGSVYAIVVGSSSTLIPQNAFKIGVSPTGSFPYSGSHPGDIAYNLPPGGSWIATSAFDLAFKTYVTAVTCVPTAAGGATACPKTSAGALSSFSAVSVSSVSPPPPSGLTFPFGLFSITENGLSPGQTVTVTITLSAPLPSGTFAYWKLESGTWTQFSSASLDSTRTVITLTLTADATGTVNDPGGPTITPTTPTTFQPVHQTPVGGVMLPSLGLSALLPWALVLSLLGVVSVESFRVKRRTKRR